MAYSAVSPHTTGVCGDFHWNTFFASFNAAFFEIHDYPGG